MGLFKGINEAEIFERGMYFSAGFDGIVQVEKVIVKRTRASGDAFIVEYRVIEGGNDRDPNRAKRSWFQKLIDTDIAYPAIKAWAAACAGYEPSERDAIEKEVAPQLENALDAATESPADNDFTGCYLHLVTTMVMTKNDREFTRHDWYPSNGPETVEFEST